MINPILCSCNSETPTAKQRESVLVVALAGNANVGKSAIFNQLTGLVQETGNWSGKTVGIREGFLTHHGLQFKIVDLPGVYSFSAYSPEELISREYILGHNPDVIIDVVDATSLERNLFFSLQLKEMGVPLVLAMNFADIARKKHIHIDGTLLSQIMGVPVVSTQAIKGIGVHELIDSALVVIKQKDQVEDFSQVRYGAEIESRLAALTGAISEAGCCPPYRWSSIKMLEGDNQVMAALASQNPKLAEVARRLTGEISAIHGEDPSSVIKAERYALAARIAARISQRSEAVPNAASRLENLSLHPITGYLLFFITMIGILIFISFFGGWLTNLITRLFETFDPHSNARLITILWNGGAVGLYAALSVAIGFILPFFLILGWLGESGYLPRIAFLMDRPCHLIGLHGQASLPLITALGCNVPACLGCRIMENRRDRLIATFLSTMVPCSARTSVVLGLVGAFVGWYWAVAIFTLQFAIIFLLGRVLNKLHPSTSPGIIMEIPEYRLPSAKVVWSQAWYRFKDFLTLGVPLIVIGSALIETLRVFNIIDHLTSALTPLTVTWLGLPAFTGVLLIFGILRKEANLALLITFAGGAQIASIITPLQMVVFSIVILLYIPCISTIAVLIKETGWKMTALMVIFEVGLALLIGGLAYRFLGLFIH
jgi:ferrous iron transport protein B